MPEPLKFKISSALKSIIGRELIVDDFIAIFELVKNSYDARAKKVEIIFKHIKKERNDKQAKIFVIDDGSNDGTDKDQIAESYIAPT